MRRVILVERPIEPDAAKLAQLDRCCAIREVAWLQAFRGADTEIVVYDASSTEAVRESHDSAEVAFTRAWPADQVNGR